MASGNKFIQQAIQVVTAAIEADNRKEFKEAFAQYKKCLDFFMLGLKCMYS
jgi:hypothetical protein